MTAFPVAAGLPQQHKGPTFTLTATPLSDGATELTLHPRQRKGQAPPDQIGVWTVDLRVGVKDVLDATWLHFTPTERNELAGLLFAARDAQHDHAPAHNMQNPQNGRAQGNSADSADCAAVWQNPRPLPRFVAAEGFPIRALPPWLARYVEGLATETQTPLDAAGGIALAVLAATAARVVEVKVRDGWVEPVNLYLCGVLPPAERKGPVITGMTWPITQQQADEAREHAEALPALECSRRVVEQRLRAAEQEAAKAAEVDRAATEAVARAAATELARQPVTDAPRRLMDDATPESVQSMVCAHGRIAHFSAEGGELFAMILGRYSRVPNLGVYLKAHAGDPVGTDRKGRGEEWETRPALTLGLLVQPLALEGLLAEAGLRGRGMHGRFLYMLPSSLLGARASEPPTMSAATRQTYGEHLTRLLRLLAVPVEAGIRQRAHQLTLHPAAREAHRAFQERLEPRLGPDGDLAHMTDWAGKLVGAVARIAGLLHLAEHDERAAPWDLPIAATTMGYAIQLGDYFLDHARVAYGSMGADPTLERLRRVLRWTRESALAEFSARACFNAVRSREIPDMEALTPALELGVSYGYLRERPAPEKHGPGRKPSPVYEVNPEYAKSAASVKAEPKRASDDAAAATR